MRHLGNLLHARPLVRASILIAIGGLVVSGSAHSQSVCALAKKIGGLTPYALEKIPSTDLDKDGIEDAIVWSCPGSGSIIPADPCTVEITLSASKKTFQLEQQRLHIIKYRDALYTITGRTKS